MSTAQAPQTSPPPTQRRWSARRIGVALLCAAMTTWCLILAAAVAWQHRWTELALVLLGTVVVVASSEQMLIREGRR